MTDTRITLKLTYEDPLQVSVGHYRDELLVHVNLTEYENKQGHTVPQMLLEEDIPVQVSSLDE